MSASGKRCDIDRSRLLWMALLGTTLVAFGRDGAGQVGCTREQILSQFTVEEHDPRNWTVTYRSASNVPARTFRLHFDGDVATSASHVGYRENWFTCSGFDPKLRLPVQVIDWNAVIDALNATSWRLERDKWVRVRWSLANEFLPIYPPVGSWRADWRPILRYTGVMARSVTVNRITGEVIKADPWHKVLRPSNTFQLHSQQTQSNLIVLVSEDRRLYAPVGVTRTILGVGNAFVPVEKLDELRVLTAESFWVYVRSGLALNWTRPEAAKQPDPMREARDQAVAERLADGTVAFTDGSAIAVDQIRHDLESLFPRCARLRGAVVSALIQGLNGAKTSPEARRRRLTLLAEFGTPHEIHTLVPMTRQTEDVRPEALAAIRTIAARHALPVPPSDDAQLGEWKKWAGEAASKPLTSPNSHLGRD